MTGERVREYRHEHDAEGSSVQYIYEVPKAEV